MNWADREYAIGRGLAAVRHRSDDHCQPYVRAVIDYRLSQLLAIASGSTFPSVSRSDIEGLAIPVAPLAEQQAISSVLKELDDKIELNRRMNETLESLAQSLFQEWFVAPAQAGLPKGWHEGKVSDLCSTQYGYTARAMEEAVGPKFLRVMDINKQKWTDWSLVPHCSIADEDKSRYALSVGDILVARMADPGKSAIVEQPIDAVFASYLVRLKTESLAQAYHLYYFLKSQAYTDYSEGAMSGSVQANMNAKVIVAAELPIPPAPLMEAFLAKVLPLRQRIVANLNESQTLAALRDALLPKLLSGEIRVKSAQRRLEIT
jgi:type I restriction enzyme S subunit